MKKGKLLVERYNAVKPVNDFKIKTQVGNYRAPSLERLTTKGERTSHKDIRELCLIRGHSLISACGAMVSPTRIFGSVAQMDRATAF